MPATSSPKRQELDFHGKTVIVTGAASGIGAAIARRFAGNGAAVLVADRDAEGADRLAADLCGAGLRAAGFAADLADEAQTGLIVERAEADFGGVDIIVHNAAYFPLTPFADVDLSLIHI